MNQSNQKSTAYKIINSIFIVVSVVLAIYYVVYLRKVYVSIYRQVGIIKTVICALFTIEIWLIGIGLLTMPIIGMTDNEINTSKMIKTNIAAIIGSILIVEMAFPAWNGLVMLVIIKLLN